MLFLTEHAFVEVQTVIVRDTEKEGVRVKYLMSVRCCFVMKQSVQNLAVLLVCHRLLVYHKIVCRKLKKTAQRWVYLV